MIQATTLLMDIGNSNTLICDYHNGQFKTVRTIPTTEFLENIHQISFEKYPQVIVSSVVPAIDERLKKIPHLQLVTYDNIPLLKLNLEKPSQVGADRIVNALGAYTQYQTSCLIIDSGTATTFCYVTAEGVYEGGAIFPGMKIASKALELYTAKIPLITVKPVEGLLGKSTKQSVQIGLYWGYIHMINGMIASYKNSDPSLTVIGTGNGLDILKDRLALDMFDPLLILKGLAICAEHPLA